MTPYEAMERMYHILDEQAKQPRVQILAREHIEIINESVARVTKADQRAELRRRGR